MGKEEGRNCLARLEAGRAVSLAGCLLMKYLRVRCERLLISLKPD